MVARGLRNDPHWKRSRRLLPLGIRGEHVHRRALRFGQTASEIRGPRARHEVGRRNVGRRSALARRTLDSRSVEPDALLGQRRPSSIKRRGMGFGKPKALTLEEIKSEVIERFVYAAKYAHDAGFDGCQIHSAHGYLLAQFLSPTTNKRDDQYGGNALNRVRLDLEIYDAIRKEIPDTNFLIGIKFNSVEFQQEGLDVNDSTIMCEAIDKKGFDFLELSGGTIEKSAFHHLSDSTKAREAFFLDFAEKIRPSIKSAALYVTGGWRTAKGMIDAIRAGSTQGVGLGRPIAAEPDLPKKILAGRVDSALQSVFEGNFAAGNLAANSQMEQAGLTTLEEAGGDPCFGIMDLSTPEVAAAYIAAQGRYLQEIEALANQGKAIAGVLEYSVTAHT
ncbi:hypothetical protein M3Y99_00737200 [Aphelenchoides fujianensis]|nr:hypothetical protein M3Y99_00737200 [Aphelenchoides fujianensis]